MRVSAFKSFFALVTIMAAGQTIAWAQYPPGPSVVASDHITAQIAPKPPEFYEDLSSITLQSSKLLKTDAVLGLKEGTKESKFTRELWQVSWREGDPIDLHIIRPSGVANPPVILYLYSYPDGTDRFNNPQWCEGVTSRGFAAVGFVSALTGHRAEYHPPKEWFVSQLPASLATTTHDVQMILNFLETLGNFDMNRVGMFGEGSGGTIAILASAADPRIKVVQVLGPWGDWPDWLAKSKVVREEERAAYLKPAFLQSVAPLDPVLWLPKVQAESFRLQNVVTYQMVPDICTKKIEAAASKTARIDDFGDSRAMIFRMSAEGDLFGWMKTQLQPDAKRTAPIEEAERVHYYPAIGHGPSNDSLMAPPPPPPGASDKPTAKP